MTDSIFGKTRHLGLPLYTDDTPLDLRDGYNAAMRTIDQKINHLEILIRETKGLNNEHHV